MLHVEQPFVAASAGLCGQPDIIFRQKVSKHVIIGDYKRMVKADNVGFNNGVAGPATLLVDCKETRHRMQLHLYAFIFYENTGIMPDGVCSLLFHPVSFCYFAPFLFRDGTDAVVRFHVLLVAANICAT